MPRHKTIFCDIEGCITLPGGGRVSWPLEEMCALRNLIAIAQERIPDLRFVLCTGRQAPYLEAVLQALGLAQSGAHICLNGSILYAPSSGQWHIHPAITPPIRELFGQLLFSKLKEFAIRTVWSYQLGKDDFMLSASPWPGISVDEVRRDFEKKLQSELSRGLIEITNSQSAVDVTVAGVNKASAVRWWCDLAHIEPRDCAGFGDSKGDAFLEVVGLPGCPWNALPEIKKLVQVKGGLVAGGEATLGVIEFLALVLDDPVVNAKAQGMLRKFAKSKIRS